MKSFPQLFFKVSIVVFALVVGFASCKKEDEPAPEIPPESSFVMDFSDFSNSEDTLGSREVTTFHNWGYSYVNVVAWSALLKVGLAVPVASFLESFNHEAVYHPDDNNWTWSYNVTVNFVVYEAELTGYLQADSVVWEMRVTAGAQYADFLWYYGKSALNGSGGYWILQENPLNPNQLLKILWHKYSDGTADISYTNVRPGDPENGGYIFYGTAIQGFDRYYNIYNKGQDNLTEIEWSSVNKDGRVSDQNHFGNTDWHCWDVTLMDIVCP